MTSENSQVGSTEPDRPLPKDNEKRGNRPGHLPGFLSEFVPTKRALAIGLVAVMVVFAGCGGGSSNGTQTAANGTDDGQPDETGLAGDTTAATATGSGETTTATNGTTTSGAGPATAVNTTTGATPANATETGTETSTNTSTDTNATNATNGTSSTPPTATEAMLNSSSEDAGLDVVVEPRTANTSDVTLLISAAIGPDSATDGIENITIDAGAGLDVSNITVANVDTAGIDEGSDQVGSQTDGPSLASNAEGTIRSAEDGEGFVIPLDGDRSVERSDEIVVVVDGGIATTEPGNYTFSLAINDAPAYEDSYNVTSVS